MSGPGPLGGREQYISKPEGPGREEHLRGRDIAAHPDVPQEDLRKLLRDQHGLCRGCEAPIPDPVFEEEIGGAGVFPYGPVLLPAGSEAADHGVMDRSGRWFCLACAVNHPRGDAARRIALEREWGIVMHWTGSERLDATALAREMHKAVDETSAILRIMARGAGVGDLWCLEVRELRQLLTMPGEKFPTVRPNTMADRILWSGPKLAPNVSLAPLSKYFQERRIFVLLMSDALRPPRAAVESYEPQAEPVPSRYEPEEQPETVEPSLPSEDLLEPIQSPVDGDDDLIPAFDQVEKDEGEFAEQMTRTPDPVAAENSDPDSAIQGADAEDFSNDSTSGEILGESFGWDDVDKDSPGSPADDYPGPPDEEPPPAGPNDPFENPYDV